MHPLDYDALCVPDYIITLDEVDTVAGPSGGAQTIERGRHYFIETPEQATRRATFRRLAAWRMGKHMRDGR